MLYKLGWINQLNEGEDIPKISYSDITFARKELAINKAHELSKIKEKQTGNPHIRIECWTLEENTAGKIDIDELIDIIDINY